MSAALPPRPSLEHLKSQAKELLRAYRAGEPNAVAAFQSIESSPSAAAAKLADAQRVVARGYGFASWAKLKAHVETNASKDEDPAEQMKRAFRDDDACLLRDVLRRHPALKAKVNEPLFSFDAPAVTQARSGEMLDVLLEAGADINARSRWWAGGFGLLDSADPDLAAYAIERGAVVTAHAAARLGMLDRLRALIDADPALVHARGGDGQTPLHFAASVEVAEFLLERGANIDSTDVDHESTPAQWMVRERPAVARFLVSRGARTDLLMAAALGDLGRVREHLDADPLSIRTTVSERHFPKVDPRAGGHIYTWTLGANKSAHAIAREFGHEDVFGELMSRSPDDLKLMVACEVGDEATFRALSGRCPKLVTQLTLDDRRKVADAAKNNNADAVRLMLNAGWPVDARGQHNGTPLHWAAYHGNAAMVQAILPHRPPLDDADNDFHSSPLGWATHGSEHGWYCRTGDYVKTVELLCAAGAKVPGSTPGTEPVRAALRRFGVMREPSA